VNNKIFLKKPFRKHESDSLEEFLIFCYEFVDSGGKIGLFTLFHPIINLSKMKFTFATLLVIRAPYAFSILLFHYLSSGCYKNDKFLKNVVRYLSS
jgi:hypothetical protein